MRKLAMIMFLLSGCVTQQDSPSGQGDNPSRNDSKGFLEETSPTIYLNDYRA